jgi:hypothetical protein
MIVLFGLVAAVAAAAGAALPWPPLEPVAAILPSLLPYWGTLALAALAGYAVATLLATAATLLADLAALRRRVSHLAEQWHTAERDVLAAFRPSRLRLLAARLAAATGDPAGADAATAMPELIRPGEVRREAARLYYIWLARSQFFTAMALLAALAIFGVAQQHRPITRLPGEIPVVWGLLTLSGLAVLAALARLAVDVAVEPVIGALAEIPWERPESRLLRRMAELMQASRSAAAVPGRPQRPAGEFADQFARALDRSRRAWVEVAGNLVSAANGLQATLRAAAESLEHSLQSMPASPPEPGSGGSAGGSFAELQSAVERLTAAIERLGQAATAPGNEAALRETLRRQASGSGQVVDELAKLLREIDAERGS